MCLLERVQRLNEDGLVAGLRARNPRKFSYSEAIEGAYANLLCHPPSGRLFANYDDEALDAEFDGRQVVVFGCDNSGLYIEQTDGSVSFVMRQFDVEQPVAMRCTNDLTVFSTLNALWVSQLARELASKAFEEFAQIMEGREAFQNRFREVAETRLGLDLERYTYWPFALANYLEDEVPLTLVPATVILDGKASFGTA